MGNMLQREAGANSLPMGEERHEGRLVMRLLDFFFWEEEEEGYFNFTIHTRRNKTSHACMHPSTHTRAAIQAHTFYSIELNLCAATDTALELFMAARLQARP